MAENTSKSSGDFMHTADMVANGMPILPVNRIKLFSPGDWEQFVLEALRASGKYAHVERLGGAGDEGRDVIAYVEKPSSIGAWDNYQAKHYDHPLRPSDIWSELGKLCYHTHVKAYTLPREYMFAAPKDVGIKLSKLLKNPNALKTGLLREWDGNCRTAISQKEILLTPQLQAHINSIDFSMFSFIPVLELLDYHRKAPEYALRFGGGLPPRPIPPTPPDGVQHKEKRYVEQLLEAYADKLTINSLQLNELAQKKDLLDHFDRSRQAFFYAEGLRSFSRDSAPSGAFDQLTGEVHDGVVEVVEAEYPNGYERVCKTVHAAGQLPIQANVLRDRIFTKDKQGICHHLANDNRIVWVRTRS